MCNWARMVMARARNYFCPQIDAFSAPGTGHDLAMRSLVGSTHAYRKQIHCIGFRYTSVENLGDRFR